MCLSNIPNSSVVRSWTTAGKAGLAVPVSQAPCQQYHLLDGSLLGKRWQDVAPDHGVQGLFPCLPVDTKESLYKEMPWQGGSVPLSCPIPVTRGLAEAAWISRAGSASAETIPGNFRLEKYFNLLPSFGFMSPFFFLSQGNISGDFSYGMGGCEQPSAGRLKWCQKAGDLLGGQFGGLPLPEHQSSMYGQVHPCC